MKTVRLCVLVPCAWLCACEAVSETDGPTAAVGPSVPLDSPPEARLLAVAWYQGGTPVYPGASVEFLPWEGAPTAFARVLDDSAVQAVEFWVGTKKAVAVTPSSPVVTFDLEEAPPYPTVVSLRVVARDDAGQEAEDIEDLLLIPAAYSWSQVVRTDWRLVVDGPDSWSPACGQVRVRARIVREEAGNPFEFLDAATWTVLLDDQPVATWDGEELDRVVDLSPAEAGPRALLVWAGLHAVNALNGEETSWSLAREVVLDVAGIKSCQPSPCSVRVTGFDDGDVLDEVPGIVFADVDPEPEGTRVEFFLDDALIWTDAAVPHVAPLPLDLPDGPHALRAVARLPDGAVCEDLARFTMDATPPLLDIGTMTPGTSWCGAVVPVRVLDTTRVVFDKGSVVGKPTADASGGLTHPLSARYGRALSVAALDAMGHRAETAVQMPHDARPPDKFEAVLPVRAWGTSIVALTWEDCAPPETLEVTAWVDGVRAGEVGLVFAGAEDLRDRFSYYELPGLWDTTRAADGHHEVIIEGSMDGFPFEVREDVIIQNAAMTGQELWLSACDPTFSSCGPVRTTRVSGRVGLVAEVPWYDADAPAPLITIRADDAVVATCEDRRCEWVLDLEASGKGQARVAATADFKASGVRLGASETFTLVEGDLDGDGFASLADGGNDCEDQDPFVHPGKLDPEGPVCWRSGPAEVATLAQGDGVGHALAAFRTSDGTLHLLHCVSSSRAFEWVTSGGDGTQTRLLDAGVPSCEAASARVAFGPAGTPWVLLDEPDADPRYLLARLDREPPLVEGLPIRADKVPDAALVVPADEAPVVLVANWQQLDLWRREGGAWVGRPVASYPGSASWNKQSLSVAGVAAFGAAVAAVQIGKGPLEAWTFRPDGISERSVLPFDLHDSGMVENHYDRLPFIPYSFVFKGSGFFSEWSLAGVTLGRVGEPVVLLERRDLYESKNLPYVVRASDSHARAWFLPTDLPDDSGHPTWSLDDTLAVSVGRALDGSALVAWVTNPCTNWGISPWSHEVVCNRVEPFDGHRTWPTLAVARMVAGELARMEVPEDAAYDEVEVVTAGIGAGEVVARVAGGGEVRILSWPCEEWGEDDTDCDEVARRGRGR